MIGTSTPEYVFIRACIFGLRAVTPLSLIFGAYCVVQPPQSLPLQVLAAYAAVETVFFFLIYLTRKHHLQRSAEHPARLPREKRRILFERGIKTTPEPESYLRTWFLGSELKEIKRENVKDFFRWGFLNTGDFDAADDDELEEYVAGVEKALGRKIEAGRGNAKCLRLTIDRVDMLHRPFIWYPLVSIVDTAVATKLFFHGFQFYRLPLSRFFTVFPFRHFSLFSTHVSPAKTLSYWHRPHTSKTRLPVLFIHGIGIGLYPYVPFLTRIQEQDENCSDGHIGIIALEIMPVSFRITTQALQKDVMCAEINAIVKAHGWDKFVLISHSYGTVISTHLLHTPETASKIAATLLVDPVTFLLHLPDVAYNFTARKPKGANEYQLYYFASKDMSVAHTLHRHFFWSENILWKEDIVGRKVTVSLGGRDLIVNTEEVGRYLTGSQCEEWKTQKWTGKDIDVLWYPTCDHAQVFDKRDDTTARLVEVVRRYSRSGGLLVDAN